MPPRSCDVISVHLRALADSDRTQEIWSVSREHLLSFLELLLKARKTLCADLSELKLRSIGRPLCHEVNLTSLNVSCNGLQTIPSQISMLEALQLLVANDNEISSIPEEIGALSALQSLVLDKNQIEHFPASLGQLHSLRCVITRARVYVFFGCVTLCRYV